MTKISDMTNEEVLHLATHPSMEGTIGEAAVQELYKRLGEWIMIGDDGTFPSLPDEGEAVLIALNGHDYPVVASLYSETGNPMEGEYYGTVYYWDDVLNDGQDYDENIVAWKRIDLTLPPKIHLLDGMGSLLELAEKHGWTDPELTSEKGEWDPQSADSTEESASDYLKEKGIQWKYQ